MDTIADLLTRIRNAQKRGHKEVVAPYSRVKSEIAKLLEKEGYVGSVKKAKIKEKNSLKIELMYEDKSPKITDLKRISKPGRRIYKGYLEIKPVLNGIGIAVVSTSKGILTDKEARKHKIGGEIICEIY